MSKLAFGYNQGLPEGIDIPAWGARMIVTQDGYTDFVANRQGFYDGPSDDQAAGDRVGTFVNANMKQAIERAEKLLRTGRMSTRAAEEFELHRDTDGVILGNTNGSAGYLYICAYLLADIETAVAA